MFLRSINSKESLYFHKECVPWGRVALREGALGRVPWGSALGEGVLQEGALYFHRISLYFLEESFYVHRESLYSPKGIFTFY